MQESIKEVLAQDVERGCDIHELTERLGDADLTSVLKALNAMEETGEVFMDSKDKYHVTGKRTYFTGVLRVTKSGVGYVRWSENDDDIAINERVVEKYGLLTGDQVIIRTRSPKPFVKLVRHEITGCTGVLKIDRHRAYVVADNKAITRKIAIAKSNLLDAKKGDRVVVRLTSYTNPMTGVITKSLGDADAPGVDLAGLVYDKGAPMEFSQEALDQAHGYGDTIDPQYMKGRTDLRDLVTITIDGDTAKDFDDAVSLRRLDGGEWELGVHIADVSLYVPEGSSLDRDAYERGTSIYMINTVVPMLPKVLSDGLCSLVEGEDRYTISCFMHLTKSGEVKDHRILPTVIRSHHRMTYNNVNAILDGDEELREKYADIVEMVEDMKKLGHTLAKRRRRRGAIDFDIPEGQVLVDENGHPTDIVVRERGESERFIETFMLAANETVAEHMHWLDVPFLYRVHEKPERKKLQAFLKMAAPLGYRFKGSLDHITPKDVAALVNKARGTKEDMAITTLLLRSMQKACYNEQCLGHFGLADEYYTHFTSPIRRYPDLLVHRMLRSYLFEERYDMAAHYAGVLPAQADRTSECERRAIAIERDADAMKKAEYMQDHIHDVYDGVVTGVTSFGYFVSLPDTVEGLVHISTMMDDYYEYDEDTMTLFGVHYGRTIRLGTKVKVACIAASKKDHSVDFEEVRPRRHRKRGHR